MSFMRFVKSVDELTNAGIKMAEVNKLKEAHIATVGAVLATPTKVGETVNNFRCCVWLDHTSGRVL